MYIGALPEEAWLQERLDQGRQYDGEGEAEVVRAVDNSHPVPAVIQAAGGERVVRVGRGGDSAAAEGAEAETAEQRIIRRYREQAARLDKRRRQLIKVGDQKAVPSPWLRLHGWDVHLKGPGAVRLRDLIGPMEDDEPWLRHISESRARVLDAGKATTVTCVGQGVLFVISRNVIRATELLHRGLDPFRQDPHINQPCNTEWCFHDNPHCLSSLGVSIVWGPSPWPPEVGPLGGEGPRYWTWAKLPKYRTLCECELWGLNRGENSDRHNRPGTAGQRRGRPVAVTYMQIS